MASHERQPVDAFTLRKLEELVRAVENFAELKHRAERGSMEKFRVAALFMRSRQNRWTPG